MSTSPKKRRDPSPYALALYRFMQSEWDALGVTPTGWCRSVGIPDPTVYRWKTGVEPDMASLRRVAAALGRPLRQVLVAAGYLAVDEALGDVAPDRDYTVPDAIERDPRLDEAGRDFLRLAYERAVVVPPTRRRAPAKAATGPASP